MYLYKTVISYFVDGILYGKGQNLLLFSVLKPVFSVIIGAVSNCGMLKAAGAPVWNM